MPRQEQIRPAPTRQQSKDELRRLACWFRWERKLSTRAIAYELGVSQSAVREWTKREAVNSE